jgi:hypothetical protein
MLEDPIERIKAHDGQAHALPEERPMPIRPSVRMCECIPRHVSRNSQQNGAGDQREPRGSAKTEFLKVIDQAAMDCVRQQSRHRQFDDIMVEPEHDERGGERKDENSRQRMPEVTNRAKAKKILEIGCEGANQHSRSNQPKSSKRESRGAVR